MHLTYNSIMIILAGLLTGCGLFGPSKPTNPPAINTTPSLTLKTDLPEFAPETNEVKIADSYDSVDPTFVIGAIVNTKDGTVHSLDNFLKKNAKPKLTPLTEVVFKNFIENSVAANASWLDFVKGQVNDKIHAEVTVTKSAKVNVDSSAIDRDALIRELSKLPSDKLNDYGVIIGYIDFILAASFFQNSGAEIGASGYGAKIGENWYTKFEDSSAHHRIVAIWSPLPFVLEVTRSSARKDLIKETSMAIENNILHIQKLDKAKLDYMMLK